MRYVVSLVCGLFSISPPLVSKAVSNPGCAMRQVVDRAYRNLQRGQPNTYFDRDLRRTRRGSTRRSRLRGIDGHPARRA